MFAFCKGGRRGWHCTNEMFFGVHDETSFISISLLIARAKSLVSSVYDISKWYAPLRTWEGQGLREEAAAPGEHSRSFGLIQ